VVSISVKILSAGWELVKERVLSLSIFIAWVWLVCWYFHCHCCHCLEIIPACNSLHSWELMELLNWFSEHGPGMIGEALKLPFMPSFLNVCDEHHNFIVVFVYFFLKKFKNSKIRSFI
jgi:hypothetical protein